MHSTCVTTATIYINYDTISENTIERVSSVGYCIKLNLVITLTLLTINECNGKTTQ